MHISISMHISYCPSEILKHWLVFEFSHKNPLSDMIAVNRSRNFLIPDHELDASMVVVVGNRM